MPIDTWMIYAGVPAALFVLWVLINLKTSRPDGTMLKVHPFRTMLTFIMPTRNESVVYFDEYVRAERLLQYIEEVKKRFPVDITHCVVATAASGFRNEAARKMNRFTIGRRLYERKGVFVTFSMKRKKLDREAKLAAVKLESLPGETFRDLCDRINGKIDVERSDKKTYTDKELNLLLRMPRPILSAAIKLFYWLDYHNLLPGSFIKADAMYTSIFVANLGSLNMGAGYHHLYEWGTCSLFVMIGKIEERPVVEDGKVVVRKMLHARFSYDERIDDGLNARFGIQTLKMCLEDPYTYFGCTREDGSDTFPLDQGPCVTRLKVQDNDLVLTPAASKGAESAA